MGRDSSFRSFDSIKAKRKKPLVAVKTTPKKMISSRNLSWLWLILIPVFLLCSLFFVNKGLSKIKVVKMFQNGRYLVLFQNNAELRPSGGFIGSFAIVEFKNYKIAKIDFNSNITKLDKAFTADHTILPPVPLNEIAGGRWALRDSNFAVSFPESAQKVQWFYNQETGENVDGVIAVNASVLRDLLKITGPITLKNTTVTINADNFYTELTNQIESEYFSTTENQKTNEPKEILKTMMPEVFGRFGSMNKINLMRLITKNLDAKEIQFFVNKESIENSILQLNYGGEVKSSDKDYLQVNVANIGGAKSSQNMTESLEYKVIKDDNGIRGDLTVNRSHQGTGIWPDGINRSWVKVLVPKGSILHSADLDGNDITAKVESGDEAQKNYFAAWVVTNPGATSILHLVYDLPISLDNYKLLAQKQSGNSGDLIRVIVDNKLIFNGILNKDFVIK